MQYPGHIVKLGERNASIVKALKTQLNRALRSEERRVGKEC